MSNNTAAKKTTVTPSDVVAQATEEKLVVPAQAEGEKKVVEPIDVQKGNDTDDQADEVVSLTLLEGGKKTLKGKLSSVADKVRENKKAVLGTVAVVGVITLAVVKYAKKAAVEVLDENLTEDEKQSIQDDLDANELDA